MNCFFCYFPFSIFRVWFTVVTKTMDSESTDGDRLLYIKGAKWELFCYRQV
jgi:hypothetical protein